MGIFRFERTRECVIVLLDLSEYVEGKVPCGFVPEPVADLLEPPQRVPSRRITEYYPFDLFYIA